MKCKNPDGEAGNDTQNK